MAQSVAESYPAENSHVEGEESNEKPESPLKEKQVNGLFSGDLVIGRGESDYVVVSDPEVEELSSEKGNSETRSESSSVGRFKSPNSSIGSYTDIGMPETEATMEVKHNEEVAQLVADARKESEQGSTEDISKNEEGKNTEKGSDAVDSCPSPRPESIELENQTTVTNELTDVTESRDRSQSEQISSPGRTSPNDADDEMLRPRAMSEPGSPAEEDEESGTIFDNVLYLGSSTVNAPVSDIELKRTMAVLREQSTVSIPVILIVGSTFDGVIRLVDPESKTDIAVYKIRKILFCGREDANERDCFAFNTCHGDTDIFHCHVFRCKEPEAAGKILKCFAQSFRSHRKRNQQKPKTSVPGLSPGTKSLEFKFDITLDIQEEDGKGSFIPVARDKNCFKLRQNLQKQIVLTVQQQTNKKLVIERCFGLLISSGRGVRSSDMHLLDQITMDFMDGGKSYVICGLWDATLKHYLVLNTETPKETRVFMTVAADLIISGIREPVRFIREVKCRIFPTGERFWNPSKPRSHEEVIMELREVYDESSGENSFEVASMKVVADSGKLRETPLPYLQNSDKSEGESNQDDDDDEPLLSGSGSVMKDCTEEELCSWSELLSRWKDIQARPRQLTAMVRKGIPEPLRCQVWQMLAGMEANDEMLENYKHLLRKESPAEQVILWDMNRTFPAHEYFKDTNGEGQESLYKINKAYSVYDEEVGYCQGLSFLSAALLLHLPEEQAFALLVRIMSNYGHRDMFRNGFEMLHLRFYQLEKLMEEFLPDLFSHFQYNNVEPHMYSSQWFLTLFTAKFPLPLVYWILDLYLCDGIKVIFQVALSLLKQSRKDLLQLDFEGILKYFRVSMPKLYMDEDEYKQLIVQAAHIKVTLKKLKKYEKEYLTLKEEQAQLEDPVERLKRENKKLQEAVMRLEHENDNLAHELVTTKVTLCRKLDETQDSVDSLSQELLMSKESLLEAEDEKEKLRFEGAQVKEMWRRSMMDSEQEKKRHTAIIEEYKQICSKLDERSEKLRKELEGEVLEIKKRVGTCETCAPLFDTEKTENGLKSPDGFRTSLKLVDSEKRLRELELELAQTKLQLVEAECKSQELEHKLSSLMSAVEAEDNKPWFKRTRINVNALKTDKEIKI